MPFTVDYVKIHLNAIFTEGLPPFSLLEGQRTRFGWKWLSKAAKADIELVQVPADEINFVQSCDNIIKNNVESIVINPRYI